MNKLDLINGAFFCAVLSEYSVSLGDDRLQWLDDPNEADEWFNLIGQGLAVSYMVLDNGNFTPCIRYQ